jgi:hypothetical protein
MGTGLGWALALTSKVRVPIPHLALAAHLNGLLGGHWLLALSYTLPMLSYRERGESRPAPLTTIPDFGN